MESRFDDVVEWVGRNWEGVGERQEGYEREKSSRYLRERARRDLESQAKGDAKQQDLRSD